MNKAFIVTALIFFASTASYASGEIDPRSFVTDDDIAPLLLGWADVSGEDIQRNVIFYKANRLSAAYNVWTDSSFSYNPFWHPLVSTGEIKENHWRLRDSYTALAKAFLALSDKALLRAWVTDTAPIYLVSTSFGYSSSFEPRNFRGISGLLDPSVGMAIKSVLEVAHGYNNKVASKLSENGRATLQSILVDVKEIQDALSSPDAHYVVRGPEGCLGRYRESIKRELRAEVLKNGCAIPSSNLFPNHWDDLTGEVERISGLFEDAKAHATGEINLFLQLKGDVREACFGLTNKIDAAREKWAQLSAEEHLDDLAQEVNGGYATSEPMSQVVDTLLEIAFRDLRDMNDVFFPYDYYNTFHSWEAERMHRVLLKVLEGKLCP